MIEMVLVSYEGAKTDVEYRAAATAVVETAKGGVQMR
jgi:hypothetical protein